jgi:2,4-diaminopentanoate dehydrogenase
MLKVVLVGMGPLGAGIAKHLSGRKTVSLAGCVDSAPDKAGESAGELSGAPEFNDIRVEGDISSALERLRPDAVILATVSSLDRLLPQIEAAAPFKADIVSTCEELSFPWKTRPESAARIDDAAKKHGITVLGTGVNPGFLMDYLPSVMTGICRKIKSIKVFRIQDASFRRVPFRKKIGAGLSLSEFSELKEKGILRHVGLAESVYMLAEGAGWALDGVDETLEPVVAEADVRLGDEIISSGSALGVEQKASGSADGKEVIHLVFRAAVGEKNPHDTIEVEGAPSFASTVKGGINGDIATCAVAVNAVRPVISAAPGLKTMLDVPVVTFAP